MDTFQHTRKVRVAVPAATGNLGPGFDCIGLALQLYNILELEETDERDLEVIVLGQGQRTLPRNRDNLAVRAALKVFEECEHSFNGLRFVLRNEIPISRGLGSSGTALVAGATAANELGGRRLTADDIIQLCAALEGHPDNIVPAMLGGLALCGWNSGKVVYKLLPFPDWLTTVVAIPEVTLETSVARKILPREVPREDAVFNLFSLSLLLTGLLTRDPQLMVLGTEDKLHQPYRNVLMPAMEGAVRAAKEAGACGAALSGAGPSVIALATEIYAEIGAAMVAAFARQGIKSRAVILGADNRGARVLPLSRNAKATGP